MPNRIVAPTRRTVFSKTLPFIALAFLLVGFHSQLVAQDEHTPNINIVSATFGEGRGRANCVAQVQQRVANPDLMTTISTPGLGLRNPTGSFRRELRITYTIGNYRGDIVFQNGESINLYQAMVDQAFANGPVIEIISAVFGEGRGRAECAAQVRARVADPDLVTTISTPGLGLRNRSGAFRRELRITFAVNGQQGDVAFANNEDVNLYQAILELTLGGLRDESLGIPIGKLAFEAPIERFCAGASGRILICHFPDLDRLVFVDVVDASILHEMPQPDDICFAANQESVFLLAPSSNRLERWSLATFEREASANLSRDLIPQSLVCGSAGDGPLGLVEQQRLTFWDPDRLKQISYPEDFVLPNPHQGDIHVSVSADGSTFCAMVEGPISQMCHILQYRDRWIDRIESYSHTIGESWSIPSFDGDFIHWNRSSVTYTYDLFSIANEQERRTEIYPTSSPSMAVAIRDQGDDQASVSILSLPDLQRIHEFSDFPISMAKPNAEMRGRLHQEPVLRYLPKENRIACISENRMNIFVSNFDLNATLASDEEPFLFINSKPSIMVDCGSDVSYQISALSSSETQYQLIDGPYGMTVSPTGRLNWTAHDLDGRYSIAIKASNEDGLEATHRFVLHTRRPKALVIASPIDGDSKVAHRDIFGIDSSLSSGIQFNAFFPTSFDEIAWGGSGRFLIVRSHSTNELIVFDILLKSATLALTVEREDLFCATANKLYIYAGQQQTLSEYMLETGELEKQERLQLNEQPSKMAAGSASNGPVGLFAGDLLRLVDPQTYQLLPVNDDDLTFIGSTRDLSLSASADGSTFTASHAGVGPSTILKLSETERTLFHVHRLVDWKHPSGDGALLITNTDVIDFENDTVLYSTTGDECYMPVADPNRLVSVDKFDDGYSKLVVLNLSDGSPLSQPLIVEEITDTQINQVSRVSLMPDQGLIAAIPKSNDRVIIQSVEIQRETEE